MPVYAPPRVTAVTTSAEPSSSELNAILEAPLDSRLYARPRCWTHRGDDRTPGHADDYARPLEARSGVHGHDISPVDVAIDAVGIEWSSSLLPPPSTRGRDMARSQRTVCVRPHARFGGHRADIATRATHVNCPRRAATPRPAGQAGAYDTRGRSPRPLGVLGLLLGGLCALVRLEDQMAAAGNCRPSEGVRPAYAGRG